MHLILLPGMDGSSALRADFVAALAADIRVTMLDYVGDDVHDYASFEAHARPLLPKGEPFILLGESFGGPLAITLAAEAPEGLQSLVLIATFARTPRPVLGHLAPLGRYLPIRNKAAIEIGRRIALGRYATPEDGRIIEKIIAGQSMDTLVDRVIAATKVDVAHLLPKIAVPTLVLHGNRDILIPSAASRLMAERVPNARLQRINGPHALLGAVPRACADAVRGFLK